MKNAIKLIQEFEPCCEQEEVDKALFLKVAESMDDSLTRENLLAHFTVSAWVMNEAKDKVLCAFHNQYGRWVWLGGHCDGDDDFLGVIKKEIQEESGVENVTLYSDGIFSLESFAVFPHVKRGKFVPAHVHLNVTYAFIADELCATRIAEGENSAVGWKGFEELLELQTWGSSKAVYQKIIDKVRKIEDLA